MAVQIQLRRGAAALWTSTDPTLAEGEIGLETDTFLFKIGDGATAWTALAYGGGGAVPAAHAASHEDGGSDEVTLAQSQITNLVSDLALKAPLASPTLTGTPAAPTAAATTNTTQIATTAFVQQELATAVTGLLDFKGSTDASGNPNYPAASKGDTYYITVAGKVGGASGKSVDIGDVVIASADNAGGTEAGVGTSWFVLEHNLAGALLSANNLSDVANAATAVNNLGGAASTGTGGLVRINGATVTALSTQFGTGSGFINFNLQDPVPSVPPAGFSLYADDTERFAWAVAADGFRRTFGGALTADRVYTLPDASITFARSDAAQTFTGVQTFLSTMVGSINGNAATVTTNANLTGPVTSVGNATTIGAGVVTEAMQVLADNTTQDVSTTKHGYAPKAPNDATKFLNGLGAWAVPAGGSGDALTTNPLSQFAATTSAQLAGVISDETGSGALVFATSPTLVTPALGTPASGVLTNCTGTAAGLTAGNVTTNANLTGPVTSSGNATTITDAAVTLAKMADLAQDQFIGRITASTGVPETATVTAAARTVLDDASVAAMVDTLGGASSTGTGGLVRATSPTLVTPALGTPSSGVATNLTGTAAGLTAGNVTTNANLTGPITSVGNATTIADAELAAIAGLTSAADKLPYFTGSGTAALADFGATARSLLDDASVSAMLDTLKINNSKSFTLENPVVGDIFPIGTTRLAQTLTKMHAFVKGSASPSVTWKIRYGTDPSAAGTVVVTAGTTTTVTGSISSITSFDNSAVGADNAIWLEITAVSGTVTGFHVTLFF